MSREQVRAVTLAVVVVTSSLVGFVGVAAAGQNDGSIGSVSVSGDTDIDGDGTYTSITVEIDNANTDTSEQTGWDSIGGDTDPYFKIYVGDTLVKETDVVSSTGASENYEYSFEIGDVEEVSGSLRVELWDEDGALDEPTDPSDDQMDTAYGSSIDVTGFEVTPASKDVGEVSRDDPPSVTFDVAGVSGSDYQVFPSIGSVTSKGSNSFTVSDHAWIENSETGEYTTTVSVYSGVGKETVDIDGQVTVEPGAPTAEGINPSGGESVGSFELRFKATASTGSDGVPQDAGSLSDLEFTWKKDGNVVATESPDDTGGTMAASNVNIRFDEPGDHTLSVTVEDTVTGKTDTVTYDDEYTVYEAHTLSVSSTSGGSVDAEQTGEMEAGTEVSLTANPDTGQIFDHWSGDVPSSKQDDPSITVTMDRDRSIEAVFEQGEGSATVNVEYSSGSAVDEVNSLTVWRDRNWDSPYRVVDDWQDFVDTPKTFSDLPAGHEYLVTAYANDQHVGNTGWFTIDAGDSVSRTITSKGQATLEPTVYYQDGQTTLEGAEVRVESQEENPDVWWREEVTDADGRVQTLNDRTYLQPLNEDSDGYYRVAVFYEGSRVASKQVNSLGAGSNKAIDLTTSVERPTVDVGLTVSKQGSIEGYEFAGDPLSGASVTVDGRTKQTPSDGRVELTLPIGTHDYSVSAEGFASADGTIDVPQTSGYEVSVPLTRTGAGVLEVDVVGENGDDIAANKYRVLVDGSTVELNAEGEVVIDEGTHTVRVEPTDFGAGEGIVATEKTVTVEADKRTVAELKPLPEVAATVTSFETDTGEVRVGEPVTATATVENTGDVEHTFFVGYAAVGPSSTLYDNDESTGKTVTLAPGDTTTVDLSWDSGGAPTGSYDLLTKVWRESDRDNLQTPLDSTRKTDAIDVTGYVQKQSTDLRLGLPASGDDSGVTVTGRLVTTERDQGLGGQEIRLRRAETDSVLTTSETNADGSFSLSWDTTEYDGDSSAVEVYVSFAGSANFDSSTALKDTPYPVQTSPSVLPFDFDISPTADRVVATKGDTTRLYVYGLQRGDSFVPDPARKSNMPSVEWSVSGIPEDAYETPNEQRLFSSIGLPPAFGVKSPANGTTIEIDADELSPGKHTITIHATSLSGSLERTATVDVYVVESDEQGARRILNDQMVKSTSPAWWAEASATTLLTDAKTNAVEYSYSTSKDMIKAAAKLRSGKILKETMGALYGIYTDVLAPVKAAQQQGKVGSFLAQSAQAADVNVETYHRKIRAVYSHSSNDETDAAARDASDALLLGGQWKAELETMNANSDMPPWKEGSKSIAVNQLGTTQSYLEVRLEQYLGTDRNGVTAWYDYGPVAGTTRDAIHFGAYGSADSDGTITSYEWQFSDGTTANGKFVSHSFDEPGSYDVTLTVVDGDGNTDTMTRTVTVSESRIDERWQFETDGKVRTSPAVAEGKVVVGSDDGHVYAIHADRGTEAWKFDANDAIRSSPTVADGTVYLGSGRTHFNMFNRNELYAIDLDTNDKRWQYGLSSYQVSSSPAVDGEKVYVGSTDASFGGLASGFDGLSAVTLDGDKEWQFGTEAGVGSSPSVADGVVYFGSNGGRLYAVYTDSGDEKWQFDAGDSIYTDPTVTDDTVYVTSMDGHLYAVDVTDGDKQWEFEVESAIRSSPTVANGKVYFGTQNGKLYAVDTETEEQTWAFQTGGAIRSTPTVVDGTVYVGSNDEHLYAIDAGSGIESWSHDTDGEIRTSPAVSGDTVYVGSDDGTLYALRDTGETTPNTDNTWKPDGVGAEDTTDLDGDGIPNYADPDNDGDGVRDGNDEAPNTVNAKPTVSISVDSESPAVGATVSFTGDASDPDGSIASYEWQFGDETTASGPTTTHTYDEPGTYEVTLTVTDDDGADVTAARQVTVSDSTPVAEAGPDRTVTTSNSVTLDGGGSTDDTGIVTFEWDVNGDGEYERSSSSPTATVTFDEPGSRTVALRVVDENGNADVDTKVVTVEPPLPDLSLTVTPDRPTTGDPVTASVSVDGDDEVTYQWDLDGDGQFDDGSGTEVTTTFGSSGSHEIAVEASVASGETVSGTTTVAVVDAGSVGIDTSRTTTINGSPVVLSAVAEGLDVQSFTWSVASAPDGDVGETEIPRDTDAKTTTFRPEAAGEYVIELTAETASGTKTATQTLTVEPRSGLVERFAPVLEFASNERYFPTRYEAYVTESTLVTDGGETQPASLQALTSAGSNAYLSLNGDTTDYPEYDDEYPPTVYASVHEDVTFRGESYTAVTYWLFYVYDPKGSAVAELVAAHPSDTETVTVLAQDGEPKWLAASQHYGGERREWAKVDTSMGSHPEVFPALGAHSNYLRDTTAYDGSGFLIQNQFISRDSSDTGVVPSSRLLYTDVTGGGQTWTPNGTTGTDYDIVVLSGDEPWQQYQGTLNEEAGVVPTQRDRWTAPDQFIAGLPSDEAQIAATIDELSVGTAGTVTTEVQNDGPKPHTVSLRVEAKPASASWDGEDVETIGTETIALGTEGTETVTVQSDTLSKPDGEWQVRATLRSYPLSVAEAEDDLGRVTARTGDGSIVDVTMSASQTAGREIRVEATVEGTDVQPTEVEAIYDTGLADVGGTAVEMSPTSDGRYEVMLPESGRFEAGEDLQVKVQASGSWGLATSDTRKFTIADRDAVQLALDANRSTVDTGQDVEFSVVRADTDEPVPATLIFGDERVETNSDGTLVRTFAQPEAVEVTANKSDSAANYVNGSVTVDVGTDEGVDVSESDLTGDGTTDVRLSNDEVVAELHREDLMGDRRVIFASRLARDGSTYAEGLGSILTDRQADPVRHVETRSVDTFESDDRAGYTVIRHYTLDGVQLELEYTVSLETGDRALVVDTEWTNVGDSGVRIDQSPSNIHEGVMLVKGPRLEGRDGAYRFHVSGSGTHRFDRADNWRPYSPGGENPYVTVFADERAVTYGLLEGSTPAKQGITNGNVDHVDFTVGEVTLSPAESAHYEFAVGAHAGGSDAPDVGSDTIEAAADSSDGLSVDLSASRSTVVPGDSVTLDTAVSGGGSDAFTYEWSLVSAPDGSETELPNGATGTVAPSVAGTYEYEVTVTDGERSATGRVTLTVEASDDGQSVTLTANESVGQPGGEATVEFNVTNNASASGFILDVTTLPDGFGVASVSNEGGWKASENKWIYQTVGEDTSVTPTVTLSVPSDAQGSYTVEAELLKSEGVVATTSTSVSTCQGMAAAIDENGDGRVGDFEVLNAISKWRNDEVVSGTCGETVGDFDVLELIELWRNDTPVSEADL